MPSDTPPAVPPTQRRRSWLIVCAEHGADCASVGFFGSREEAEEYQRYPLNMSGWHNRGEVVEARSAPLTDDPPAPVPRVGEGGTPTCDCAACAATRAHTIPQTCCPRGNSHQGATCVCGLSDGERTGPTSQEQLQGWTEKGQQRAPGLSRDATNRLYSLLCAIDGCMADSDPFGAVEDAARYARKGLSIIEADSPPSAPAPAVDRSRSTPVGAPEEAAVPTTCADCNHPWSEHQARANRPDNIRCMVRATSRHGGLDGSMFCSCRRKPPAAPAVAVPGETRTLIEGEASWAHALGEDRVAAPLQQREGETPPTGLTLAEQEELSAFANEHGNFWLAELWRALSTERAARREAELRLGEAAREINCAGPVAHRIRTLKAEHEVALATAARHRDALREAAEKVCMSEQPGFNPYLSTVYAGAIAALRAALSRPTAGEPEQEQNRSGKTGNVQLENH